MKLKPQSIRKGVSITLNGVLAEKQEVMALSENWTEPQTNFFKKMLQQGGTCKIQGVSIDIVIVEKMVTSRGEKDTGAIIYPGLDSKF